MTLAQVMSELKAKGSEATKRTFARHGAKEPFFGVKVADLKVIQKKIKGDQALALALYATGNGDAQYLAGLVINGRTMTSAQLETWVDTAAWSMISEFSVPWAAAENPEGLTLALRWIDSSSEAVASSGWTTLSALAAVVPDEQLPMKTFAKLLDRVVKTIATSPDRVRYTMNGFVIACGTYLEPLGERALATARKIGVVEVDMGETACKVPDAASYITQSRRGSTVAPKRKTVRC